MTSVSSRCGLEEMFFVQAIEYQREQQREHQRRPDAPLSACATQCHIFAQHENVL
jgi:hypothetical protein